MIAQQTEVRVVAATGVCGSGFKESSFEAAMAKQPHFIGCDCGSTDPGPFALGTGKTAFSRASIARDLRIMLKHARRAKIPLLLGSAGTAGGDPQLALFKDIIEEIAAEEGLKFKMALIHAEQGKDYLKKRMAEGRIKPLSPAPVFDEGVVDRAERIVGMMGEEPFLAALDNGADVVVAGRASDCAIYAGIPMKMGIPAAVAWHAAKILECGAASVKQRSSADSLLCTLREDHFDVEPLDPALRCTPQSVASHSLYENADPYRLVESTGTVDLTEATYEALDDRRVRVRGSRFEPAERYTVKLEGAERVGFQTIVIGSVRDPYIIRQLDDWLARFETALHARVADVFNGKLDRSDYIFNIRIYGKNGTMGPLEPTPEILGHEVLLILEATAPSQETATAIASMSRHMLLHLPIPEWGGLITGLACVYNPSHLERGAIHRFCVNHIVEPDDPYEMFPIDYVQVG